ncbi:hypothetical protein DHEL01_v212689, partial [Diaporthe helianthi]
PEKTQRFLARVDKYDQALRTWLASLPPHIQFSANSTQKRAGGDPDLVMCVITFVLHAGSLLSLYRKAALEEQVDIRCHLTMPLAVHYMTLSGIVLLCVPPSHWSPEFIDDVEKCIAFLKDMEVRWSGAKRSQIIIEQLLQHQRGKTTHERNAGQVQSSVSPALAKKNTSKKTFDDFEAANTPRAAAKSPWGGMPGSGSFPFDPLDPALISSWDRYGILYE